jgi:hypothetical protein
VGGGTLHTNTVGTSTYSILGGARDLKRGTGKMQKFIVRSQDGMRDLVYEGDMEIRDLETHGEPVDLTKGYGLYVNGAEVYYNVELDAVELVRDQLYNAYREFVCVSSNPYSTFPKSFSFFNIQAQYGYK